MYKQYAIRAITTHKVLPKYFDTIEEAEKYRGRTADPSHWEVVSRTVTYSEWETE